MNVVMAQRVEFLRDKEAHDRQLRHEISEAMNFFDVNSANIVNFCSPETQHKVFEMQEKALHTKSSGFVKELESFQKEILREIKNSSLERG